MGEVLRHDLLRLSVNLTAWIQETCSEIYGYSPISARRLSMHMESVDFNNDGHEIKRPRER